MTQSHLHCCYRFALAEKRAERFTAFNSVLRVLLAQKERHRLPTYAASSARRHAAGGDRRHRASGRSWIPGSARCSPHRVRCRWRNPFRHRARLEQPSCGLQPGPRLPRPPRHGVQHCDNSTRKAAQSQCSDRPCRSGGGSLSLVARPILPEGLIAAHHQCRSLYRGRGSRFRAVTSGAECGAATRRGQALGG
jgi:hypothetical protein